ncbi:XRE family transcriptional regulator [Lactobacillus sp. ESL0236]|uniref:helix-turn-helix transcriptional regulator n=1 Tax=unclassified Lactobacillus TaxID=2620435 RepID=UPI000EFCF676|nr:MULTISPECIES: helix-turn-helix transcriptional regulator [unclassified Lactobacillus]RMC39450.1 XRE family transcriptional regulator [Lactobacillus sp. ESL0237]RMC43514.1 XRE family transcriptional regulator [Lactobacillus sp. ESL0234]RMC44996.1 XRE family transcriptional regulator [Lactobacillus sp. ESL0236]
MELGDKIKHYRIKYGLTQEQLAKKLLVSRKTVSSWENDRSTPNIEMLFKLCSIFEISLDELGSIQDTKLKKDNNVKKKNKPLTVILYLLLCAFAVMTYLRFFGFKLIIKYTPFIAFIINIVYLNFYSEWSKFSKPKALAFLLCSIFIFLILNCCLLFKNNYLFSSYSTDYINNILVTLASITYVLITTFIITTIVFFSPFNIKKLAKNNF